MNLLPKALNSLMPAGLATILSATLANGSIMSALGPPSRFRLPVQRPAGCGLRELPTGFEISRWPMTWTWTPLMMGLAIAWGVFTVGLIILLIYRSTLPMHEGQALYLGHASAH